MPPRMPERMPAAGAAWFALLAVTMGSVVSACPFCGVVGQSLAERRDEAAVVAVGEATGDVVADAAGRAAQPFRVHQILRGADDGLVAGAVAAEVVAPVTGTALLFAAADGGHPRRWSAVAADEALLGYVVAAPASNRPPAERLRWFAARLEHPDRAIAEDAFTEFGRAPYAAVREAGDAFDCDTLRGWVAEPGIEPRRRGLYGLALGIVAAITPDVATRAAAVATLRAAIDTPASDFRAGFDGLLGGLLVAEGPAGLDWLEETIGLGAARARPADQKHFLAALRFAGEELTAEVPRSRIVTATTRLLASPVVAADAAIDLARYQAWDHAAAVAALWDELGDDDPIVRRAVAGYLSACPRQEAKEALDNIRRRDPDRLAAALAAAALPR